MKKAWLSLVLLLAATIGCGRRAGDENAADARGGVAVRTEPAELRTIRETVTGLGRCAALPQHLALLTTAIDGRVVRLLAKPGDSVQPGQEIVRLDPLLAKTNLEEKRAARDAQAASLRLLESRPRTEEQSSAKLAIQQARLAVERSQSIVDHLMPLRARNEISDVAMREAQTALTQAELQLKTAEAQYQVLMLKPRPQAIDEGRLRVTVAETAVATAQTQLDLHTIRAPIGGVLDSLSCQLGQMLSLGASVGQVVDAQQLHVVVWLSLPDTRRVCPGQTARIAAEQVVNATGAIAETAISGRVLSVGTIADPQTGNLSVRVLVDNASGRLAVGQVVTATVFVGQQRVLAVPAAAVYDLGDGPLVSTIRDGKTVLLRPALGLTGDGWIAVAGTELKAGEPVIVEGGYALPEETPVIVEKAGKVGHAERSPTAAAPAAGENRP